MKWFDDFVAKFSSPRRAPEGNPGEVRAVELALAEIAPLVDLDGGKIELVSVHDGWVVLELRGACEHCAMSDETLLGALEPRLRERLPGYRGLRRA